MSEFSGPQWCDRFPGSNLLTDLESPFREDASLFVAVLTGSGASVKIAATYRPPERAWLMHYACMIAGYEGVDRVHRQLDPRQAPPVTAALAIDWTHGGDTVAAVAAAKAMVAKYGIVYPAALVSRHTQRKAVDMHVSWAGTLTIVDKAGAIHHIADGPRDGTNEQLAVVGKTYNVVKNPTDAPHWSTDGR